jgi:hypothetical protein
MSALRRDFQQGGPAAIAKVQKYQPAAYMKICALMIPFNDGADGGDDAEEHCVQRLS